MTTQPKDAVDAPPLSDLVQLYLDIAGSVSVAGVNAVRCSILNALKDEDPCDTCPYNAALQSQLADAQARIENQTVEIRRLHKTRHGTDERARDLLKSQLAAMTISRDEWKTRYESADRQGFAVAKERDDLAAWKESAMTVMRPDQAIAKEIGVPLGASIHDKILPWIVNVKRMLTAPFHKIPTLKDRTYSDCLAAGHVVRVDKGEWSNSQQDWLAVLTFSGGAVVRSAWWFSDPQQPWSKLTPEPSTGRAE